jgi:hypothetical protein
MFASPIPAALAQRLEALAPRPLEPITNPTERAARVASLLVAGHPHILALLHTLRERRAIETLA